jgi:type IV pilus assembly protein PilW
MSGSRLDCILRGRGLTLIELLVALVMGLVLIAGVVTVFVANKETYRFQDAMSRLQENGRLALLLLERDLRNAGAGGCIGKVTNIQVMLNKPAEFPAFYGPPIVGIDNWNGSGTDATNYFKVSPKLGTDVITIRGGEGSGIRISKQPGWTAGNACGGANIHTTPHADICKFDNIMVTNCKDAAIMQATNVQANSGQLSVVDHNTGTGTPGNETHCVNDYYGPPSPGEIVRLNLRTYYVKDNGRQGTSLYRAGFRRPGGCPKNNQDTPISVDEELVEGVEDMQVLYGIDKNGDGNVTYEVAPAATSDDWGKVVSVRVNLLLQSVDPKVLSHATDASLIVSKASYQGSSEFHSWDLAGVEDSRLRQTYMTTVAVRNRVP